MSLARPPDPARVGGSVEAGCDRPRSSPGKLGGNPYFFRRPGRRVAVSPRRLAATDSVVPGLGWVEMRRPLAMSLARPPDPARVGGSVEARSLRPTRSIPARVGIRRPGRGLVLAPRRAASRWPSPLIKGLHPCKGLPSCLPWPEAACDVPRPTPGPGLGRVRIGFLPAAGPGARSRSATQFPSSGGRAAE